MKKLLTLLLPLALVACNAEGSDGYKFEQKEYEHLAPNIEFRTVKNQTELEDAYRTANGTPLPTNRELKAFSILYPDTKTCIVFIIDPEEQYGPQWIGHEVVHCMYGQFHPSQ